MKTFPDCKKVQNKDKEVVDCINKTPYANFVKNKGDSKKQLSHIKYEFKELCMKTYNGSEKKIEDEFIYNVCLEVTGNPRGKQSCLEGIAQTGPRFEFKHYSSLLCLKWQYQI